MSSPTTHTAHFAPSTPPNRISNLTARLSSQRIDTRTRTPTPGRRQRNSSHLASSLFQNSGGDMAVALSSLPPDYPGDGCKAGEVFMHEWPIYEVKRFRDYVEGGDAGSGPWGVDNEQEDLDMLPEPLRRGIVIAGGWFKLDLARSVGSGHIGKLSVEETTDKEIRPSASGAADALSLYVAALSLDSSSVDITYPATIFVGIKPLTTPTGSRYAETRYHWSITGEWEFNTIREFWEVEMPKLSDLLLVDDIVAQDGFTICVQISTPAAMRPTFGLPGQIKVPRSLIAGLSGLIDSSTGDVKFVCLEHTVRPLESDDEEDGKKVQSLSRKRVLYAHSEILKASCDYFHDLLTGEFEEADRARRGDSRYTTILVDDAGFETVYWLLKFIYTNELTFAVKDDVRQIMDQLRIEKQEIARILSASHFYGSHEWEYRHLYRSGEEPDDIDGIDSRTIKSVSSASTRLSAISPTPDHRPSTIVSAGAGRTPAAQQATTKGSVPLPTQGARPTRSPQPPVSAVPRPRKATEVPAKTEKSTPSAAKSPNPLNRSPYVARVSDPHPHPCPPPPPASPLSVFMLSHRYRLETLEQLAKDHILEQMTKENCMPMLLATYQYDALHAEVLDYIIDNWTGIQPTPEFLKCIQEVSAGIWDETGGMVLHGLFRRL